jgi:hypothetical protein
VAKGDGTLGGCVRTLALYGIWIGLSGVLEYVTSQQV